MAEAWTADFLVLGQALYHWAILPSSDEFLFFKLFVAITVQGRPMNLLPAVLDSSVTMDSINVNPVWLGKFFPTTMIFRLDGGVHAA